MSVQAHWQRLNGTVPEWHERALCAEVDPSLFYSEKTHEIADAKRVCGLCPVILDCLEWAVATREPEGVWGGAGPAAREQMHAGTRPLAPPAWVREDEQYARRQEREREERAARLSLVPGPSADDLAEIDREEHAA